MAIYSLPLATRPLLMGGKKSLETDPEKPDPALLAKKAAQAPATAPPAAAPPAANTPPPVSKPPVSKPPAAAPPAANTPPPVSKPSAAGTPSPAANTPPPAANTPPPAANTPPPAASTTTPVSKPTAANTTRPVSKPTAANTTTPVSKPTAANTTTPVGNPSAAPNSAAAAQLATLPPWLNGLPAQNPASSGAASSPLIPLGPEAASAGKTAPQPQPQQQQTPTAPAAGQQPAASAQTPATGQPAAAAPRPAGTPPPSTPAAGSQPKGTPPPAPAAGQQPAAAPQPSGTTPSAASTAPAAPAGRAAATASQAQPRGISAHGRGDAAAAVKMQSDIANGKVIQDGKVVQHPDKSGDLYQTGFIQPTFTDDAKKGTTIPYRDDHGKVHHIGVQDMRRITDAAGNASYSFQVNGKYVRVPEDSKAPLFQIDPQDGRRFTTAPDGTRRELGYDKNAAAQAGIAPREKARNEAREKLLTQGAALSRQLQEKQAQAAAAQQRMDAAKQKYDNPGNATDAERQANYDELMGAFDAHNKLTSEVQTLQQQHDDHYQNLVRDQRARQAEIDQYKAAAAEHPEDEQWRKDSRHTRGDTRHTDADLIAEAEKKDPATAAAIRSALTSQYNQRTLAAAQSAFGSHGRAAGAGNTMTLHDMLMHAPEMKQGGWRPVDQADAARATAQGTFGITDPENVHVTPGAGGGYSLSRKSADGSPGQPFATMDGQTGRITLLPGPDGRYSQAARDLAARSTPGSAPIYLGKGTPLTEAERSALIAKGQQATAAAKDRRGADAALTAAGLSPEGIQKLRNEGRLSVQDANFLNNKFNSGFGSYAQRDAYETAQKQSAGLQQMYQDTKAPAGKPSFKSWMEKGDPQRDAQVQAKAKELGMSEDDVRRAMEDQRRTDFATPLTQEGHDQQSGMANAFLRGSGFSGHDQDSTRTLTDGSLVVNPALTDDKARFEKAIQDSNASPEAKAAALKSWPAQHDAWLTRATETLKASKTLPGVEDYNEWLTKNTQAGHFSQKMPDGSVRPYTDNEKTQIYLDAMKNRSGVRKFMDNVSTSLVAGGGQVVSGLLGAAALAGNTFQDITGVNVGGEAASEAAAAMAQQNQTLLQPHELTGTIDGPVGRVASNLIQAVPSIGVTVATGGTAGLLLGAAQGAGSTYTDLLQTHIKAGDSIEEAHKKAAGAAIASGAVGLALSKIMPGGAQALNNPAAQEAARKSFGAAVKSAIKGGAEEISQEAIDGGFNHILTEMHKGKTFEQAATSYAEQFPQSALTSALLGGGVQAMADKNNGGQNSASPPTEPSPSGYVDPAQQRDGPVTFTTVDAEGLEVTPPPPGSPPPPPGPRVPITPIEVERRAATAAPSSQQTIPQPTTLDASGSGKPPQPAAPDSQPPQKPGTTPSSPAGIPDTTTPSTAAAPPGMEPSKEAASAGPVMTMENGGQVLGTIDRLKAKEKNGALTKDEQIELHHNENILARTQATNLEAKQKALSKLPTPRELHSTELAALAKAKAMLARPWPGTAPATNTQSSSGSLPPGDTSTTHGVTPPTGSSTATSSHAGTGNTTGTTATGSTTSTASSGDTPAPGSGTHTTNGVTAPPVGHGNRIPEDTTHPEHIDLAKKRVENLGKIAAKRKLNPHEQDIYDNALRVRDRNTPAQPGDRNSPLPEGSRDTSNPQDLVMAGGDGPSSHTQSASADAPPPAAPAQPANAIGTTINGPSTANPDAPRASVSDGLGSSRPPAAPQQQPVPHGGSPTNGGASSSGQPPLALPASTQASTSSGLPQSGTAPAVPHRSGSHPEHTDPRLKEAFKNWPHGWDEQGFPNMPHTLPDGHDLLQPTHEKDTAILPADHHLVQAGLLPAGKAVPRSVLHAAIMNYIIHRAAPLAPGVRPTIYVSGGGGGAGKSTILHFLHERGDLNTHGAVEINADDIKELIPEYDAVKATGDGRAADVVHEESSTISKALLERAMSANGPRYNIVYDATLANVPKTRKLLAAWKARGYNTHLVGVTIDPREGITRAFLRAKDSGRWVPASVLKSAHDRFNSAVKEYADIADSANIYDNTQSVPVEIASKTPSQPQLSVVNKALWDTINTRTNEKPTHYSK